MTICLHQLRSLAARSLWTTERGNLLLVFLCALAVRVLYNLTVARHYVPVSDASEYVRLGQRLLAGKCYCLSGDGQPTTYRSPGFPLFLAAVFAVAGPTNALAARLALSVVGAATCVVTSLIARELFGARAVLLAGLIAATYPQLFINDAWLNSESLATFLFAASCLAVMRVVRHPLSWRWLATGGLLALTALTRPNGIYALGVTLVWLALAIWRRWLPWRRGILGAALILAGCALLLAPWTARNYVVTQGAVVPLSTGGGAVIAGAYTDLAYRGPNIWSGWFNPLRDPTLSAHDHEVLDSFFPVCWGRCEVARDQATADIGLRWARTHLAVLPWLVVLRWIQLWTPANAPDNGGMPIWRPFAIGYPTLVIVLAAVGVWTLRRRWRAALIPCLFGASIVAGCLLLYGSPRMRAMLEPLLVVLAAGALLWLFDRLRTRLRTRTTPAAIAPGTSAHA